MAAQVKHAQEAGASSPIVYDDVYEALIIMSKARNLRARCSMLRRLVSAFP